MTHIREKPPLRTSWEIETPGGRHFHWSVTETDASYVPSNASWGDGMPGGYDQASITLPRKPQIDYQDLERLSTLRVRDASAGVVGEYRLERTPRSSGDEFSITPNAVGFQADLEDNQNVSELYVDRDLNSWRGMSNAYKEFLYDAGRDFLSDGSIEADRNTGIPSLTLTISTPSSSNEKAYQSQMFYDGTPNNIGQVDYTYTGGSTTSIFTGALHIGSNDLLSSSVASADLLTGVDDTGTGSLVATAGVAYPYASIQIRKTTGTASTGDHVLRWTDMAVWGDHDLDQNSGEGVTASDVITHVVGKYAPRLHVSNDTVQPTGFAIPQLVFKEPTTVAEVIKAANRFHLYEWAVWHSAKGPTFYYGPPDSGTRWQARVRESSLEELGPQMDRVWNGVVVSYRDVDGTVLTVGPTDSSAITTDDALTDNDPENPANAAGVVRWAKLDMGIVSTAASAVVVGMRFLMESKDLDRSGSATLEGWVRNDHGVLHPYHHVKAGDSISFVDASDSSYRRINRTQKSDDHTVKLDLEAPPEGLDALLERLGVVLVPLGVG